VATGLCFEKVHLWQWLRDRPDASLEALAQDLVEKSSSGTFLLGYSLGARLAQQALMAAPDHFSGALLVSAHPGLSQERERQTRLAEDARWALKCREFDWDDFLVFWNNQPTLAGESPEATQALCEPWRAEIARAFEIWSLGHQPDSRRTLRNLRVPTLWLAGSRDSKFLQLAQEALSRIPNAASKSLKGGHRLLLEAPQALGKALLGFLDASGPADLQNGA
jgi:2-succinyl-6-hydroxy-2,4-cyclohexadiene-1-carboxylate synthase